MPTNIWAGIAIVLFATLIAIGLLLLLRRRAPEGGFFSDSDRAASVFACIATMFSVLLALVIFLSVETYSATSSHAHAEADSVIEQFQLAHLFPSRDQYLIQSQLICYGRTTVHQEWPLMNGKSRSPVLDEWAQSIDSTTESVAVNGSKAEAAFQLFLTQTLQRQQERRGRLEGADGALPATVWPILFLGAACILAYMIAYADSAERATTQVFQVGLVTVLLGFSLLLIHALDHPFGENAGQIQPGEMQASLETMERGLKGSIDASSLEATLPCDSSGLPRDLEAGYPDRNFAAGSTMGQIAARGKIVIGVTRGIALFGEINPVSNEVSGFDVDLAREIAKELGLHEDQIEFVDTLVEERIPHLEQKKVDLVVLAFTITPERGELIEFSRPYFLAGQSILVQRNNRSITNIRELAGRRVCVVSGSTSIGALSVDAPRAELVYHQDFGSCVNSLKAGTVDAVSTDDIVLAGFAAEDPNLVLVGGQFTREPYGVGIPKGQADMVQFVDGVIERMVEDGRWGKLYYKYLGDIPGLRSVSEAKERLPTTAAP